MKFLLVFSAILFLQSNAHSINEHGRVKREVDYNDYGENDMAADKFSRPVNKESEEIISSEEEDYDDEAWRKKGSREELLNDVKSLENEVGADKEGSFKLPKLKNPLHYETIGDQLLQKYDSWIWSVSERVTKGPDPDSIQLQGITIDGISKKMIFRIRHEWNQAVTKFIPVVETDGNYKSVPEEAISVNWLSGHTSCGSTHAMGGVYVCIKPLDIHIRVRSETEDAGPVSRDLMCLQLYLPSWNYGYEFCYQGDGDIKVKDKDEDHWFRKMRLFIFNGGTFSNWKHKFFKPRA